MTDLALIWDAASFSGDLAVADGDLATDSGLRGAIMVSLFSDARARADDELPYEGADRRGWWGDVGAQDAGDALGSRLWLLARAKRTPANLARAREAALEALDWLMRDGVVAELDVTSVDFAPDGLKVAVVLTRPGGPARQRYDFVWKGLIAE